MKLILSWVLISIFCLSWPLYTKADESCDAKGRALGTAGRSNSTNATIEALRRLVRGYVRAEKASMEAILNDVNLLFQDVLDAEILEELVMEAINENQYADRLIHNMLATINDPDCTEREFDLSPESGTRFNPDEAAEVLHKCKVVVLRNALEKSFLLDYKANFTAYIRGLHDGRISNTGTTTNGEKFFINDLHEKRWEVLLPKEMAHKDIVANADVMHVLQHDRILGSDLVWHSMGTALADPGCEAQQWHADSDFIFSESLYDVTGVSHHELPAYAITMMVPLLDMTMDHGPTQFCIGSSNLAGLTEIREDVKLRDESLRPHLYEKPDLTKEDDDDDDDCKHMRTPLLGFGDMLLFDYQIIHRGGKNVSPDLRAMLYMTYSRFWYKDKGFEEEDEYYDEDSEHEDDYEEDDGFVVEKKDPIDKLYKQLTETARFAIPDDMKQEDIDGRLLSDGLGRLEDIKEFKSE